MNREVRTLILLILAFLVAYFLPADSPRLHQALVSSLSLLNWYAREHVLFCLVPAFFIAGAIATFVRQNAVLRYFGPKADRRLAYGVASLSGALLAVCSCTVLPIFGGIYMRGAGLGPAITFLYSGPAINVTAVALTGRVIGWPLGLARAIGAVGFSLLIGLTMHRLFRREDQLRAQGGELFIPEDDSSVPLRRKAVLFLLLIAILIFATWPTPSAPGGLPALIHAFKWPLVGFSAAGLALALVRFFGASPRLVALIAGGVAFVALGLKSAAPELPFALGAAGLAVVLILTPGDLKQWGDQTWSFAKQITPLLFGGVLAAGFLLGAPESPDAGIIPSRWIRSLVGSSPEPLATLLNPETAGAPWLKTMWQMWTNLFAAFVGALMYFATLTEVPIVRGLLDHGMSQGPALALLLAGPAVSLPNLLVIQSILGRRRAFVFAFLVIGFSALAGLLFDLWSG